MKSIEEKVKELFIQPPEKFALEVRIEDLEWEKDVYLEALVKQWTEDAKNSLKKL